ncbi:STAS domain-containing protein [Streptomyces purpurogeneiscleroticus]|uniref:STAS domain-containing protein n=1 Tax=Streptomyces purpurogeneiscleroticus TaxID=68259 RepID=UPI0027DED797|nr:STAS domain-containing protein [Streptomyces purpurogeneiscleroticus]
MGGITVMELSGELDILARINLADRIDVLTSTGRPDLVVDLRRVTFMDCGGLSLLCRARLRILSREGRLRLVADDGSPSVVRLLRLTGLLDAFEIHADLRSALDPLGTTSDDAIA